MLGTGLPGLGPQGAERAPVGWAGRGAAVSVGGVVAIGRTPRRLRRLRARRGNVVWEDFLEEEEEFQGTWRLGTSFDPQFSPCEEVRGCLSYWLIGFV